MEGLWLAFPTLEWGYHPHSGAFHDLWGGSLITEQNRDGGKPGKSMDREYRE